MIVLSVLGSGSTVFLNTTGISGLSVSLKATEHHFGLLKILTSFGKLSILTTTVPPSAGTVAVEGLM